MNLILFPHINGCFIEIPSSDPRYLHIKDILKSKIQDELAIGQINGKIGSAKITAMDERGIGLEVIRLDQDPPKPLPITLILALPRPPMLQRTLSAVASMGIKKIYLIQTYRVEKSYWNSHVIDPAEIEKQLILGLEQGKDTVLPEVHLLKRFKIFVEDELSGIAEGSLKVLAHPDASSVACPANVDGKITLVIGPEGGFIPYEVELLKKIGFQSVELGQRILRFETAVVALISKIARFS